jgi:hypothetical protein
MDINYNPWALGLWLFLMAFGLPLLALGIWLIARQLRKKQKPRAAKFAIFLAVAVLAAFVILLIRFASSRS